MASIPADHPIDPSVVARYHNDLLLDIGVLDFYKKRRGINIDTVKRHKIGWHKGYQRFTIPVYNEDNECWNIRLYKTDPKEGEAKVYSWAETNNGTKTTWGQNRLYPIRSLYAAMKMKDKQIILCEGEHDALILNQSGYLAVTGTAGAGSTKLIQENVELFRDLNVVIIFDCDEPGRKGAHENARTLMDVARDIRIVDLGLGDKEDVSDWFVKYNKSAEELSSLILATPSYDIYTPVDVVSGVDPKNYRKKIKFPCQVVGKDLSPYIVPRFVMARCTGSKSKKVCDTCVMQEMTGEMPDGSSFGAGFQKVTRDGNPWLQKELTYEDDKEILMQLVAANKRDVSGEVKNIMGLPKVSACREIEIDTADVQKIELVSVIPEVDFDRVETSYALRQAYCFCNSVEANHTYVMKGTLVPSPNTQAAVFAVCEVKDTKDSITKYLMTPEHKELLKVMQPKDESEKEVFAKLTEICQDLAFNVTKVWGRADILLGALLVYHSPLSFKYKGSRITKGWLECAIVGDTSTGKSETIKQLVRHVRAGEYVSSGEHATIRGILGALQQIGKNSPWTVTWGKVPLNDKGLVVLDEMDQLAKDGIVGALSGVRSEGKATILKVQTQETNARTRLIWIANPLSGRVSEYDYGVEVIKELFKEQQDIRRIDFAVGASKGDVSDAVIHKQDRGVVEHKITSDVMHISVMRAWNLKVDDIHMEEGVERLIVEHTMALGKIYSEDIPLFLGNGGDQKIVRLAVAMATMLYSTTDGHNVLVKKVHVEAAVHFLKAVYASPSIAFDMYSQKNMMSSDLKDKIWLVEYFDTLDTIDAMLGLSSVEQTDLEVIFDKHREDARALMSKLYTSRAIRKVAGKYYKKSPSFISWLRDKRQEILRSTASEMPF